MSAELKSMMEQVAREWNTKFDDLGNGVYRIDVPLRLQDGSFRYQFVFGKVTPGYAKGKDVFYFNSRAGVVNPGTNFYTMLKEASLGVYSMVTIIPDQDQNGNPREVLLVQASPIAEYSGSYDLIKYVIAEVGEVADYLEGKYFGGDNF